MEPPASPAKDGLRQLLTRRGWAVLDAGRSIVAHKHEWPAQLRVVVDPGTSTEPSVLGITLDFRSMPLAGERFRDIFNSDRERLLRGMGAFRVRQMNGAHHWSEGAPDRIFLHGVDGGVLRSADVVLLDRTPEERGEAIVERFALESTRLLETGGEIASLLQRTYNRAVLTRDLPVATLPDVVVPAGLSVAPAIVGDTSYPWRR
jgi:hypothetical protein